MSIELTVLSNHLITLPLYDDCTKLWICPVSLKKKDLNLKPKYTSHSFNRCLSNSSYALTRTTSFDQDQQPWPLICFWFTLYTTSARLSAQHTLLWTQPDLLPLYCHLSPYTTPSKPWDTYFQDSSCTLSSKAFLSPPGTSYQDDFTKALILQYLSLWLHCELPEYRDCIPDLCIPSVSSDGHQMLAAQMLVPRGPSNMHTVLS